METNEKVQYWLELADDDLRVSKSLFKSNHRLHMGFFCHLTIEKALKAVISHVTDEIPPKTHQLVKLAEKSQIHTKMTEEQQELLIELNPLHIEGRYPEYKEAISQKLTDEKCEELIQRTEELLCWIKQQLSTQPTDTQEK